MFFVPFTIIVMALGFFLYFLTYIIPLLRWVYFDWLALGILIVPSIVLLYGITSKKLLWFMEKTPKDKTLILFLRRNGEIVPVLGSRAYPGESFIDVPKLGLLHDLGKGSVYNLGMNKLYFALENVNHTPNPKYANFTNWLYEIGFNNIDELHATIYPKKEDSSFSESKQKEVAEKIEDRNAEPIEILEKELKATTKPFPKKTSGDGHTVATQFLDRMRKEI